ncbi:MAG: M15 family metallopeptidase [Proteobacteria bacterium]|nr:M15 family metallopeptidase [Pseudomonadota bacterium]
MPIHALRVVPAARYVCRAAIVAVFLIANSVCDSRRTLAADLTPAVAAQRLIRAYPEFLAAVEGNALIWTDGTRMTIDDGAGPKPADTLFAKPDLKDMFHWPYPAGAIAGDPGAGVDPGRIRNAAFFAKMYGRCSTGDVQTHLVDVAWLPKKSRQHLKVTRINGVADRLRAVSAELDELPAKFDAYLFPSAGTYNCRPIAGTEQASAHGFGIAIDIALKHSHYWRWSKPDAQGNRPWRNAMPPEIVAIFETHGFIWGGRWSHYDTMHFEYRPELIDACVGDRTC